MGLSITITGNL